MTTLGLATALAAAVESSIPFEAELEPPEVRYSGAFDRAPVPHWRVRLPGGKPNSATHSERSAPAISGEWVFVGAANDDALNAHSRRDGSIAHRYPAAAAVQAAANVVESRVYFSDTGGSTWCYSLEGEELWVHDSQAPILVRPTVSDGTLYVQNVTDLVVALDATTGELKWRYQAKGDPTRETELTLYGSPPPVLSGGDLLVGFSDGSLVSLDPDRGEVRWSRRVGEGRYPDLVAAAVPLGRDVFAAGYYLPLVAVDRGTQNVRWRLDVGAANAPWIDPEAEVPTLYHPGTDGKLRAVATLTGAERWTWDSATGGAITTPVPTVAGLLVGSSEGSVYLVDPQDGTERWRYSGLLRLSGVTATPAVSGRQLVFVTNAGYLYSMLVP